MSLAGLVGLGLLLLGSAGWGVMALWFFDHASFAVRLTLAAAFAIAALVAIAALALPQWRWYALAAYAALFAVLLWRWSAIAPSNDRDWRPEGARLAYAEIAGNRVTLHNIRNFDYRSETDYTPRYYDRTVDLGKLDSVDVIAVYWMGPAIAHVFLSFGFEGKDHVAVSIEARKERSEGYSTLAGFFRQYELLYVVADERDVIRLRTNYRRDPPEDVHLYRLRGAKEDARRLFLEYLDEVNRLCERPEFYNTLLTNCTTNIWLHSRVVPGRPYSWRILVSGHVPGLLYDSGRLDTRLPFAELQRRSRINELAQAADKAEDFSQRIRAHLAEVTSRPA